MDETSLRTLFDQAVSERPPTPRLVPVAIETGHRIRRRRNLVAASATVLAVGVIAGLVPLAHGLGFGAAPARPAAGGASAGKQTAYIITSRQPPIHVSGAYYLVPVDTAAGTTGKPIPLPDTASALAAAGPHARTIYVLTESALIPVDTATNTAGRPIPLPDTHGHPTVIGPYSDMTGPVLISPGGRTAYVLYTTGVLPVDLTTGLPGKLIAVPDAWGLVLTPDGRTLYVIRQDTRGQTAHSDGSTMWSATPIDTASGHTLPAIQLGRTTDEIMSGAAVTPDGGTVVLCTASQTSGHADHIFTIDTATGSARSLTIPGPGCSLEVGDHVAYAAIQDEILTIDTSTDTVAATTMLPSSRGWSYLLAPDATGPLVYAMNLGTGDLVLVDTATDNALPAPSLGVPARDLRATMLMVNGPGTTILVGSTDGLIPVSTTSRRVGRPIRLGGDPLQELILAR
jgi:hypothetical protein